MKTITIISLIALSLLQARELEKEIVYLNNNGKVTTHKIVCFNGKTAVVSIDNSTNEMRVGSSNLGKITFQKLSESICK